MKEMFRNSDMLLRNCPPVTGLPQLIRKTFEQRISGAVTKLLKPYWTREKL
jgi:hypothetical protein